MSKTGGSKKCVGMGAVTSTEGILGTRVMTYFVPVGRCKLPRVVCNSIKTDSGVSGCNPPRLHAEQQELLRISETTPDCGGMKFVSDWLSAALASGPLALLDESIATGFMCDLFDDIMLSRSKFSCSDTDVTSARMQSRINVQFSDL